MAHCDAMPMRENPTDLAAKGVLGFIMCILLLASKVAQYGSLTCWSIVHRGYCLEAACVTCTCGGGTPGWLQLRSRKEIWGQRDGSRYHQDGLQWLIFHCDKDINGSDGCTQATLAWKFYLSPPNWWPVHGQGRNIRHTPTFQTLSDDEGWISWEFLLELQGPFKQEGFCY